MNDVLNNLPTLEPGTVWLAGAGPGDPGLLTLHALNAIRQADVIVYDALVSKQILDIVERPERLIFAGKRGGSSSPHQDDITLQLIELAKQSKRVVRFKGGDPFVFGRGGEEALELAKENIPFRIIPGITAGIAALSYAGIPATHRTINTVVSFITGQTATGANDTVDWQALSDSSPVLVFYMGMTKLAMIRDQLLTAGRAENHPVAFIEKASTPDQKVLISTLRHCVQEARAANIEAPVIIAVGDVVNLHAHLDWFDTSNLEGASPFKHTASQKGTAR